VRLSRLAAPLACALAAGAAAAEPARDGHLLDAAADEVVARAFVPSPEQRVGEVRLVRRGDANVVQTLLYTKVASRAVAEIRAKELAGWPDGPGRADALRYVEALEAIQRRLWQAILARGPGADRRQRIWIEFVLAPRDALVAIGSFEMEGSGDAVRVTARETLATLAPARSYVRRSMALIAADSFHARGEALSKLLAPLALVDPAAAGAGPTTDD
jgi:hypothetical protein